MIRNSALMAPEKGFEMKQPRPHNRQHGVTLMETLIASAILTFAIAAITQSISAGQMQTYAAMHDLHGMSLVEAMMEEIQSLSYNDPQGDITVGPDTGETSRALFDNCDDFQGFSETAGNCADVAASPYGSQYADYSRTVSCVYGTMTVAELGGVVSGLTVTVTVTDTKGTSWTSTLFSPQPTA